MSDKTVSHRDASNTILPPIVVHPLDLDHHREQPRPGPADHSGPSMTAQAASNHAPKPPRGASALVGQEKTVR